MFITAATAQPYLTEDGGRVDLASGTLYVPRDLEWSEREVQNGTILHGKGSATDLYLVTLEGGTEVNLETASALIQEHLQDVLGADHSVIKESLPVAYPWPDSLEIRFADSSVYVGSGSDKTLLITATGKDGPTLANSVAGSFKESYQSRRDSQIKGGAADKILSLIGVSTTLILLGTAGLFAALALLGKRKGRATVEPMLAGLVGLGIGLALSVAFILASLPRFTWAAKANYATLISGVTGKFVFLLLIGGYLWKRQSDKTKA